MKILKAAKSPAQQGQQHQNWRRPEKDDASRRGIPKVLTDILAAEAEAEAMSEMAPDSASDDYFESTPDPSVYLEAREETYSSGEMEEAPGVADDTQAQPDEPQGAGSDVKQIVESELVRRPLATAFRTGGRATYDDHGALFGRMNGTIGKHCRLLPDDNAQHVEFYPDTLPASWPYSPSCLHFCPSVEFLETLAPHLDDRPPTHVRKSLPPVSTPVSSQGAAAKTKKKTSRKTAKKNNAPSGSVDESASTESTPQEPLGLS